MITIKEMADMLGLSTTTVSNVIHGKTKEVSEATVERVRRVLQEYDYVPNISARNLASNQSKIIGVAILNSRKGYVNYLKDAFISELLGSIERELKERGYYLMMCFSSDTRELIQRVSAWNADGLILFGRGLPGHTETVSETAGIYRQLFGRDSSEWCQYWLG